MYHEEREINGVLHWRGTPDGNWTPYSATQLTAMLKDERINRLVVAAQLLTERNAA